MCLNVCTVILPVLWYLDPLASAPVWHPNIRCVGGDLLTIEPRWRSWCTLNGGLDEKAFTCVRSALTPSLMQSPCSSVSEHALVRGPANVDCSYSRIQKKSLDLHICWHHTGEVWFLLLFFLWETTSPKTHQEVSPRFRNFINQFPAHLYPQVTSCGILGSSCLNFHQSIPANAEAAGIVRLLCWKPGVIWKKRRNSPYAAIKST